LGFLSIDLAGIEKRELNAKLLNFLKQTKARSKTFSQPDEILIIRMPNKKIEENI